MLSRVVLIVGGCVGLFQVWQGFATGAASEKIRRDERPFLFWSLMCLATFIAGVFLYFAAFGHFA
jgi:hypothetical protein